jgi:hypothetical protein
MRLKPFVFPAFAIVLLSALVPATAQTVPAYTAPGIPLNIGLGPSIYNVDWGHGHMLGGTIWADWYPRWLPSIAHGLGVELEARDISFHRGYGQQNLRHDTAGGGPIYAWRHFYNFHPYAKYLISYGSIDFTSPSPTYSHDTRKSIAPGGGVEYRFYGQFWARADYEYQFWQKFMDKTSTPQGFTFGVAYDFSHPRKH